MRHPRMLPLCAAMISIAWTGTAFANDASIAKQLSERLKAAKSQGELKDFRIGVKVEKGVVWLSGHVQDERQQQKAIQLACAVSGVRLVVNDIDTPACDVAATTPDPGHPTDRQPQSPSGSTPPPTPANQPVLPVNAVEPQPQTAEHGPMISPAATVPTAASPLSNDPVVERHVSSAATVTSHSPAAKPVMIMPNMGYVGVVPTPNGIAAVPPVVQVVPAIVPFPAGSRMARPPHAKSRSPRPVPMARSKPARLVNYYDESPDCYEGGPVGIPVPQYGTGGYMGGGCAGGSMGRVCMDGGCVGAGMGGGGYAGAGVPGGGYAGGGLSGVMYENPQMPNYAWPSYASHPNYAAVTYPRQYSASAWPYIGPFYPYPQVPLGWRKVCLEWDDGWWMLDFKAK